jgi:hypothetical protein
MTRGEGVQGVEVFAIEANSTRGVTTITAADGSYSLNVTGFARPLRLFASNNKTQESFSLTALAFEGQNEVNISETSHAITQAMGNAPSLTRQNQLAQVLQNSLGNYGGLGASEDLVRIAFASNGILLESKANPTQRVTINTTTNSPSAVVLPAVLATETGDANQFRALVKAFGEALIIQSNNASKLNQVLHADFQDSFGLNASDLASLSNTLASTRIFGFEILRCFPDTPSTQDSCLLRVYLKVNANDANQDFGNPNFAQVELITHYDLIAERRTQGTDAGQLKLAGGQFRPYAADGYLIHLARTNVQGNGNLSSINPIQSFYRLNIETSQRANQDIRSAVLLQNTGNTSNTLLSLSRVNGNQCTGVFNLVRNPLNSADCTNLFLVDNVGNLEVASRTGQISLGIQINNSTSNRGFPFVRIKRSVLVNNSYIPSLNASSLRTLHAYGTSTAPASNLNIELSPPIGFNEVCIAANLEESTQAICVRGTRQVSIPNTLLPPRLNSYVIYTTDNEGNRFAQQYFLQ